MPLYLREMKKVHRIQNTKKKQTNDKNIIKVTPYTYNTKVIVRNDKGGCMEKNKIK